MQIWSNFCIKIKLCRIKGTVFFIKEMFAGQLFLQIRNLVFIQFVLWKKSENYFCRGFKSAFCFVLPAEKFTCLSIIRSQRMFFLIIEKKPGFIRWLNIFKKSAQERTFSRRRQILSVGWFIYTFLSKTSWKYDVI